MCSMIEGSSPHSPHTATPTQPALLCAETVGEGEECGGVGGGE